MRNEITPYFLFSLLIHLFLIGTLAIRFSHPAYIVLPIELMFYSPASSAAAEKAQLKMKRISVVKKKDKEAIMIARKDTEKAAAKKTEQPSERTRPAGTESTQLSPVQNPALGGTSITLDTAHFPYAYYTNTIVKKIAQNWGWSNRFGNLKALIYFKIEKNGDVKDLQVKTSSGQDIFDAQAMRSVMLASPFPPLPSGYQDETLGVFFEFSYTD